MRIPKTTKQFRRQYAKFKRSGKDITKLDTVMRSLVYEEPFLSKHRDHALKGEWQHLRDCHIEGDWLLLYQLGTDAEDNEIVAFHATGTHENLFG